MATNPETREGQGLVGRAKASSTSWRESSSSTDVNLKPWGPDIFQISIFSKFKKVTHDLPYICTITPWVESRATAHNQIH